MNSLPPLEVIQKISKPIPTDMHEFIAEDAADDSQIVA